jgi:hypothetical protein
MLDAPFNILDAPFVILNEVKDPSPLCRPGGKRILRSAQDDKKERQADKMTALRTTLRAIRLTPWASR